MSTVSAPQVKAMFAGGEPAQLLSFGDEAPITVDDADLAVPADNIMLDMDLPAALEVRAACGNRLVCSGAWAWA